MRKSIRTKLFFYMLVVIFLFAFLLFIFNTFFAEEYYIYQKKNTLIAVKDQLENYLGQYVTKTKDYKTALQNEELIKKVSGLEKKLGGTIVIGKDKEDIYYPVTNGPNGMIAGIIHNETGKYKGTKPDNKIKKKPSAFIITKDPDYDINTLRYQIKKDDGLIIVIWVPMAEISENASLSNRFTIIIGILTTLLTGGFTFFVSDKFTRPIKEMNDITARMSKLDFSKKLRLRTKDELGELSENINQLSDNLNEAIEKLNQANSRLAQDIDNERRMEKLRREFIANVSHELKTPVFLIQGYAEGLMEDIADDAEKRQFYCQVIMDEAEKMDALIKELLDLSRLEQGKFSTAKEKFNLSLLLENLINKYMDIIKEKGFSFEKNIPENVIINADRIRTEQVLTNYLVNVIRHIRHGNEAPGLPGKKVIRISLKEEENRVIFSIYNTCPPIPEEGLNKLWQSFYKRNSARTREDHGTGLGLAIVRAIQEAQGFSCGVRNEKDGILFWCDFLKE